MFTETVLKMKFRGNNN